MKFLALAIGGLLLNGFGLSLLGQSVLWKGDPASPAWWWVLGGTLALTSVNAGICLVVDASKRA